jgi:hypothetical protein
MMMVLIRVYSAEIYILCRKTQKLVAANKENALEVNAEETNYMAMCRDQHAGQDHINVGNKSSRSFSTVDIWNNLHKSKFHS